MKELTVAELLERLKHYPEDYPVSAEMIWRLVGESDWQEYLYDLSLTARMHG